MIDWRQLLVAPREPILDALKRMESGPAKILLVVDDQKRLMGTVTDGDVRRGILAGVELEETVGSIMNTSPMYGRSNEDILLQSKKFGNAGIRWIPVVDSDRRVSDLRLLEDAVTVDQTKNWIVIMAGGVGSRLRPLTADLPKPMLEVGGRPILETIVHQFVIQGFKKIFISVNYKAEKIQEYFGDGSRWGISIN